MDCQYVRYLVEVFTERDSYVRVLQLPAVGGHGGGRSGADINSYSFSVKRD